MRLIFLLILALLISVALIVFPHIADQALRLEAFGLVFETRQGAFIVALFCIMLVYWLFRVLVAALFAGPGHIWQTLSMGSGKRRERRLQTAIEQWLNGNGDLNARTIKRSRNVMPDWALNMLAVMGTAAKDQPAPHAEAEPLQTVMIARSATSPVASPRPDLSVRKAHLKAWLAVSPDSALARTRMADVAEEEGNWQELVNLLEAGWKKGHQSAAGSKGRLIHAYLELASADTEQTAVLLRKAYRLNPSDPAVMRAYGRSLLAAGDKKETCRLWLHHLQYNDDMTIARELLPILAERDVISSYRKLERKVNGEISHSLRWLRAELAHAAELNGLAFEQMQLLADEADYAPAWISMAGWHDTAGEAEQAAECYRKALAATGTDKALKAV